VLNAVLLSTYDHLKHLILQSGLLKDGQLTHFTASMGSGLCITVTTLPFDVVKTRIQNQSTSAVIYRGITDCAWKLLKEEGVLAFYKGFTPYWLRVAPYTIFQLMMWERLRKYYGI
jgi:hypothetical protein